MAVRFGATTSELRRTTSLPTFASFTAMAWVKFTTVNTVFADIFTRGTAFELIFQVDPGTSKLKIHDTAGDVDTGNALLVANRWYHVALTRDASAVIAYLDGVPGTTITPAGTPGTDTLYLGNGSSEDLRGDMAAAKFWDRVLSQREIQAESSQMAPRSRVRLNSWYRLANQATALIDSSGQNRTLTRGGTQTTTQDPPGVPLVLRARDFWMREESAIGGSAQVPYQPNYLTAPVMAQ
jgi:hypothetical protein